jgi:hypothetical protein
MVPKAYTWPANTTSKITAINGISIFFNFLLLQTI